jgi:hypothetical protein
MEESMVEEQKRIKAGGGEVNDGSGAVEYNKGLEIDNVPAFRKEIHKVDYVYDPDQPSKGMSTDGSMLHFFDKKKNPSGKIPDHMFGTKFDQKHGEKTPNTQPKGAFGLLQKKSSSSSKPEFNTKVKAGKAMDESFMHGGLGSKTTVKGGSGPDANPTFESKPGKEEKPMATAEEEKPMATAEEEKPMATAEEEKPMATAEEEKPMATAEIITKVEPIAKSVWGIGTGTRTRTVRGTKKGGFSFMDSKSKAKISKTGFGFMDKGSTKNSKSKAKIRRTGFGFMDKGSTKNSKSKA